MTLFVFLECYCVIKLSRTSSQKCLISRLSFIYFFATQSSEIRRRLSSELVVLAAGVQALTSGNITPCSVDTSYNDRLLDTPTSSIAGSSTSSQAGGGTPYSSRSGTPFSQDSGYTSGRFVFDACGISQSNFDQS